VTFLALTKSLDAEQDKKVCILERGKKVLVERKGGGSGEPHRRQKKKRGITQKEASKNVKRGESSREGKTRSSQGRSHCLNE